MGCASSPLLHIEIVVYFESNFLSGFDFKFFQNRIWEFYSSIFTDYNIKFLFHCTLLRSRKVPCIQCLYSRKNTIRPFLLQDNAHFHSHCYIDQSFLAESSGLFLLKTLVHHTSYGCMDWFTNAKQANIRRETYTSQLMKGGHFTMNLPLFISSANENPFTRFISGFVFFTRIDSAAKNPLIKRYLFYLLLSRIYCFSPLLLSGRPCVRITSGTPLKNAKIIFSMGKTIFAFFILNLSPKSASECH